MGNNIHLGHAADVAQIDTLTVGAGPWVAGEKVTLTVGAINLTITIGTLVTTAQVAKTVKQAWQGEAFTDTTASVSPPAGGISVPQFAEMTASVVGSVVTFTGKVAGVPFILTSATDSAAGTVASATGTAATGKTFWSNPDNWSLDAVPVNGDDVTVDSNVDITDGLAQSGVTLNSLTVSLRYLESHKIGRLRRNPNGYVDYRLKDLQISATTGNIGTGARGTGGSTGLLRWDAGANAAAVFIYATGRSADAGLAPVMFKGSHAGNSLNAMDGWVDVAMLPGETANLTGGLKLGRTGQTQRFGGGVSGALVRCGSGVTLATVTKDAGNLEADSNITQLNSFGGDAVVKSGNVAGSVIAAGSTVYYLGVGTITAPEISGRLDLSRDERGRTVVSAKVYRGGSINDPAKTGTWTNGILLAQCQPADVALILGPNRTWTPS